MVIVMPDRRDCRLLHVSFLTSMHARKYDRGLLMAGKTWVVRQWSTLVRPQVHPCLYSATCIRPQFSVCRCLENERSGFSIGPVVSSYVYARCLGTGLEALPSYAT